MRLNVEIGKRFHGVSVLIVPILLEVKKMEANVDLIFVYLINKSLKMALAVLNISLQLMIMNVKRRKLVI